MNAPLPESFAARSFNGALRGALIFLAAGWVLDRVLASNPLSNWLPLVLGVAGAWVGFIGKGMARGMVGALAGVLLGALGGGWIGEQFNWYVVVESERPALEGQLMEIAGPTVDGSQFDVAQWRGKVVLVDFWATWCGPCRAELPNVKSVYEKYHAEGFEVVGVSLDNAAEDLQSFVKTNQIPWPQVYFPLQTKGEPSPLATKYGINGIPAMFLLDREGKVADTDARANLERGIKYLLANQQPRLDLFPAGLFAGACFGAWLGSLAGACGEWWLKRQAVKPASG
jgi:thiol-disulfide isomerase/thioredoxin